MTLYVGLFRGDAEVAGWVLGHYSDFGYFRDVVREQCQDISLPLLLGVSDCDALFRPDDLPRLKSELLSVAARFRVLPPMSLSSAFAHNESLWSAASSLHGCFHNVDGELLIEALIGLCDQGIAEDLPLAFQ